MVESETRMKPKPKSWDVPEHLRLSRIGHGSQRKRLLRFLLRRRGVVWEEGTFPENPRVSPYHIGADIDP